MLSLMGDVGVGGNDDSFPNISKSLQLELFFVWFFKLQQFSISSSLHFIVFSTVHSRSENFSQFCIVPLDSSNFSRLFSKVVDVEEELLSLKMTRLEFSIEISEVLCTCTFWFITDFSTTILCESSTTFCTFSESVSCWLERKVLIHAFQLTYE